MRLRLQTNQLIALVLCFYVFIFTLPYFVWFKPWVYGYFAFFIYIIGLALTVNKWHLSNKNAYLLIIYSAFCIFTYIPFRQHDELGFSFLIPLFSAFILLYKRDIAEQSLKVITNIFFIISLLSLVNIILYATGLNAPITTVTIPGRVFDTYDVFFGTVVIPTQYFKIFGAEIFRNHGWFQEPGHFAIYLSFILALQKNPFNGIKNKIMLVALFSTFSASGFLMLFIIAIFKINLTTRYFIYFTVSIISTSLLYILYLNNVEFQKFINYWFLRKFEASEGIIASRRSESVSQFLFSYEISVLGYGSEFLKNQGIIFSDYMAHIYKHGLLSILFLFSFWSYLFLISIKTINKKLTVIVLLSILTFLHRSFMVTSPIFVFFIWLTLVKQERWTPVQSKSHFDLIYN